MQEYNRLVKILDLVRAQIANPSSPDRWNHQVEQQLPSENQQLSESFWSDLKRSWLAYQHNPDEKNLWKMALCCQQLAREFLTKPLESLSGIGPKIAGKLAKKDLQTVADLLYYFPRAYTDQRYVDSISTIRGEGTYTIFGEIITTGVVHGRKPRLELVLADSSGQIQITFWNMAYLGKKLTRGTQLFCHGKVDFFRNIPQMNNPEYEIISSEKELESSRTLKPVYSAPEGIKQYRLKNWIDSALDLGLPLLADELPVVIRKSEKIQTITRALSQIHQPDSTNNLERARERVIFEEFFLYQLVFALHNWRVDKLDKGRSYPAVKLRTSFLARLPFDFTEDQRTALQEIEADLVSSAPMHRLLQGDVGTGKTVVALAAMLRVIENGYQAALMAPTEVLAEQHYQTAQKYCQQLSCKLGILTGSLTEKNKQHVRKQIEQGEIDLVIGTHALIEDTIEFPSLGFVVIDEQHRFGVEQRRKLREKGPEIDMLIMSATPIPRSLALTVYGDLLVTSLTQFPGEKRLVETTLLEKSTANKKRVFELVKTLAARGEKTFFVFPAIEENQEHGMEAAEAAFEKANWSGYFSDIRMGLLHGQMSSQDKQQVMKRFRNGEIQLLFSTTVIEVGVDVPEASCLVVFDAERFGLAQLHQLRGRVGRAGQEAYCFLFVEKNITDSSKQRLHVLERIDDGFEVAKEDLRFRGIGALTGTRQTGLQEFKLGNFWQDREIMQRAVHRARWLVESTDGLARPELTLLRNKLFDQYKDQLKFVKIG